MTEVTTHAEGRHWVASMLSREAGRFALLGADGFAAVGL